jgi:hypothetical protein
MMWKWSMMPPPEPRGIAAYQAFLGKRYATFLAAFESLIAMGGQTVVELGTSRSFVDGKFQGCMQSDPRYWRPFEPRYWDWGAGIFTRMCPLHLQAYGVRLHTVDTSAAALAIARTITSAYADSIDYHLMSSLRFLQQYQVEPSQGLIDFVYMDAGETGPQSAQLHLQEAQLLIARPILSKRALILIDDVNLGPGQASKGAYSIPFLLAHGFEVVMEDYQVLLQRRV